jgi:dTDP-glucose pyrophosphorylase
MDYAVIMAGGSGTRPHRCTLLTFEGFGETGSVK